VYCPNTDNKDILGRMKLGASKAAKIAKVARSTIYKDMDDGNLSFDLNNRGNKVIDISELERVYGPLSASDTKDKTKSGQIIHHRNTEKDTKNSVLSVEVKMLREQIERIDETNTRERERLERQLEEKTELIDNLSKKLDKAQDTIDRQTYLIEDKTKNQSNKALIWIIPIFMALIAALIVVAFYSSISL